MKKCLQSTMIKKHTLTEEQNTRLSQDLVLFNQMKRTSFAHQVQDRQEYGSCGEAVSAHMYLKNTFGVNDYFANSACREAKALISSQKALRELYTADLKEDIAAIKKTLKKKVKYLCSLEKVKQGIIDYCKARKQGGQKPEKYLKGTANIQFLKADIDEKENIPTRIRFFQKEQTYPSIYLFEHQWLDPKIKSLRQQTKQMEHKQQTKEAHLEKMKHSLPSVHFGGKKWMNDRAMPEHRRCMEKRRNRRMQVSGRLDSLAGNFVFRYDPDTKTVTYRSMTGWDGERIPFPVCFPYGQEELDTCIREKRGAVSWELIDCGNAWQLNVIVPVKEAKKNSYYGDGCIGVDINYDNIAVSETDPQGNLLSHTVFSFQPEGLSSGQMEQTLSGILEQVFQMAREAKKPITAEDIKQVQRKKFYDKNTKRTRHISLFACTKIRTLLESKSGKYETVVTFVNPAYTSKAGLTKYVRRYGLSIHEAASFCIARRGQGYQERLPRQLYRLLPPETRFLPLQKQWKAASKLLKGRRASEFYTYCNPYTRQATA